MTSSIVDGNIIYFFPRPEDKEIDVTEILRMGKMDVLPGIAFDEKNGRIWVHSKLFKKYTRIDNDECRFYVSKEWFTSEPFNKQQESYPDYLLFIKRNCRNHARKKGTGIFESKIIIGKDGRYRMGPIKESIENN